MSVSPKRVKGELVPSPLKSHKLDQGLEFGSLLCHASRLQTSERLRPTKIGHPMRLKNTIIAIVVLLSSGATVSFAQESHIGSLAGHASAGKALYRRYCIGCHGPQGDGAGENAAWIDPKPRDFTAATFKCRSTLSGTLPTDQDLYNAITRGFVNTSMPSWKPLTDQNRADLVAYVKTFSAKWKGATAGESIAIPAEPEVKI